VKTKYQVHLVDPDTGQQTLHGCWGKHARFDELSDAEQVVAELERVYPGSGKDIEEIRQSV
jgi:hypothetical protein